MHAQTQSGYSVIRAVDSRSGARAEPVGVVAWDGSKRWYRIRVLARNEATSAASKARANLARLVERDLHAWAQARRVPYAPDESAPWTSEFWESVSRIMRSAIQLDSPRVLQNLTDEEEQFELLFEAVAKPKPSQERTSRAFEKLNAALGRDLRNRYRSTEVDAFHGRREKLARAILYQGQLIALEAIHLASQDARKSADAMVSRLRRIKVSQTDATIIVGYLESPNGLNGESDMLEWIRDQVTDQTYSLITQGDELRRASRSALENIGVLSSSEWDDLK